MLKLRDIRFHDLYRLIYDATALPRVFPGYARLALYRANLHLGAGRMGHAEGELREAILRCGVWPHDDLFVDGHPWGWLSPDTTSQCPPPDADADGLRNVMAAVLRGCTPLLPGTPSITTPWYEQASPRVYDKYTNFPYHTVLGYTVTDPRRPYEIVWSAEAGLHAKLTRDFSGVLSTYGLLGRVKRIECPRDGALGRKRSARGDYTHLVTRQVSGEMAHDGKFAIPLDEASGIGAFINGARTHSEATVCSEWIEIPFVRTDGSLGKEWVMIMKTKRLLFRQEALLYKYSDCFETPTQALLRHADLRAAARTMLPHLDVCVC